MTDNVVKSEAEALMCVILSTTERALWGTGIVECYKRGVTQIKVVITELNYTSIHYVSSNV